MQHLLLTYQIIIDISLIRVSMQSTRVWISLNTCFGLMAWLAQLNEIKSSQSLLGSGLVARPGSGCRFLCTVGSSAIRRVLTMNTADFFFLGQDRIVWKKNGIFATQTTSSNFSSSPFKLAVQRLYLNILVSWNIPNYYHHQHHHHL